MEAELSKLPAASTPPATPPANNNSN